MPRAILFGFITFLLLPVLGTAPGLAMYAPCQPAEIWVADNKVNYQVYDPYRGQWMTAATDIPLDGEVVQTGTGEGIVVWFIRFTSAYNYKFDFYVAVYDPALARWNGGLIFSHYNVNNDSFFVIKDGVVEIYSYKFLFCTYDAEYHVWRTISPSLIYPTKEYILKDGVVAHYTVSDPHKINVYLYDQAAHSWRSEEIPVYNYVEGSLVINNATVEFDIYPFPFQPKETVRYGYNYLTGQWVRHQETLRRAHFVAGPAAGPIFLVSWFWDYSVGLNSGIWSYDFGDGGGSTSTSRSPFHVYNSVGQYTATLTVAAPGQPNKTFSQTINAEAYTPPSGCISINNGDQYTNSYYVKLYLNPPPESVEMSFASLFGWTAWESCKPIKEWTLFAPFDGEAGAGVRFRTLSGAVSPSYNDRIIVDRAPPESDLKVTRVDWVNRQVYLEFPVTDNFSGVKEMRLNSMKMAVLPPPVYFYSWSDWVDYAPAGTLSDFLGGKIGVEYRDWAGNVSSAYYVTVTKPKVDLPPLVAFYPFDGDARDASLNHRHATVHDAQIEAAGFEGQAYRFDGATAYITAPVNLNPSRYPRLTLGAWVKPSAIDPIRVVLSQDDGIAGYSLAFDRSITVDNRGDTPGWSAFCGTAGVLGGLSMELNKWVFLAAVYDQTAKTVTLYAGDQAPITKTEATLGQGRTFFDIGRNPTYGSLFAKYFEGCIDNVFVFAGALNPEQIAYIRDTGAEGILTGIRGRSLPHLHLLLSD